MSFINVCRKQRAESWFGEVYYGIKQSVFGIYIRLVDNVDSKEFLTKLFDVMYGELPTPKKKK